jgi:hypothetical protein
MGKPRKARRAGRMKGYENGEQNAVGGGRGEEVVSRLGMGGLLFSVRETGGGVHSC